MSDFDDLLKRIEALTGLTGRDAAQVAFGFDDGYIPSPVEIMEAAERAGFDVEMKHTRTKPATPIAEMSMDPAVVMEQVYWMNPILTPADANDKVHIARLGKAPDEARQIEGLDELIAELPDDIALALVKIDLLEGKATIWLRDEANDIDRPIGPIDLAAYGTEEALMEALRALAKRVNRVLASPWN